MPPTLLCLEIDVEGGSSGTHGKYGNVVTSLRSRVSCTSHAHDVYPFLPLHATRERTDVGLPSHVTTQNCPQSTAGCRPYSNFVVRGAFTKNDKLTIHPIVFTSREGRHERYWSAALPYSAGKPFSIYRSRNLRYMWNCKCGPEWLFCPK